MSKQTEWRSESEGMWGSAASWGKKLLTWALLGQWPFESGGKEQRSKPISSRNVEFIFHFFLFFNTCRAVRLTRAGCFFPKAS